MGEVLGIIMVSFVLPLIIVLHYMTKWKESKGLSREDVEVDPVDGDDVGGGIRGEGAEERLAEEAAGDLDVVPK